MEADFYRDYRLDLREVLSDMSWRRFLVYCRNLSPYGSVAVRIRAITEAAEKEPDPDASRAAAEAFFTSVVRV